MTEVGEMSHLVRAQVQALNSTIHILSVCSVTMLTDADELILHSVKVLCLWHNIIRCTPTISKTQFKRNKVALGKRDGGK